MIPYIDELNLSDNEDEEDNSEEVVGLVDVVVSNVVIHKSQM